MPPENSPIAPDTADFLLEVGVEELPSHAVASALAQLSQSLGARLVLERLAPEGGGVIETLATPRRLTVCARNVPLRQPDSDQEVRGPGAKAAFGPDGAPTKAALGFAAKNGVGVESLAVVDDYVVARKTLVGRPAGEVLGEVVPDLLKTLTFPKFMRWGAGSYRFGRPLRRFVALLGRDVVPFEVDGVVSGRETLGHRFLSSGAVVVDSPNCYADALRAAFVEPDPAVRRERIITQARALAARVNGIALLPDALVDENVYLTEWVTCVLGSFDPDYLSLPRPVLETAMKKHQRFFPVEGADGALLPHFIAVRSGSDAYVDTVRAGYENVLASRFSDAKFFFDHDRATPLDAKVAKTERIVFQEKLGTLAQKTVRLESLMEATHLFAWTHHASDTHRALRLSKADLASEIVTELPALQGVMGREFARADGENALVADALYEQYLPRFAGDTLPTGKVGTALALADRVDTLTGYMLFVGAEPKGSSDPFGLKRAATAIVDLLARDRALPPVSALIEAARTGYEAQGIPLAAKPGDIRALLETRLRSLIEERGARYDLADALLAAPWDRIASVVVRADVLRALMNASEELSVARTATRVRNILKSVREPLPDAPDVSTFTTPEERTVWAFLGTAGPQAERDFANGEYTDAIDTLAALSNPIGKLFDNVMIMDEDPAIRTARLALLAVADRLYLQLADFSRLILE